MRIAKHIDPIYGRAIRCLCQPPLITWSSSTHCLQLPNSNGSNRAGRCEESWWIGRIKQLQRVYVHFKWWNISRYNSSWTSLSL